MSSQILKGHPTKMDIDIVGRVRNSPGFLSKPLMPLFEAVVNSIHSIEDLSDETKSKGKINIHIKRDEQEKLIENDEPASIVGFIIEDNGIGFDENNYKSFQTSDTTWKESRGAKGIGRFSWLKAFDRVHINSVFKEKDEYVERDFDFILTSTGVTNPNRKSAKGKSRKTIVELISFKRKYMDKCPKRASTIAMKIIEHCLVYFLSPKCPKINLVDGTEQYFLNDIFREQIQYGSTITNFDIDGNRFDIISLQLYSSEEQNHLITFCAHHREVKTEKLSTYIPELKKKIDDDNGSFIWLYYVSGSYLDDRVNADRTEFELVDNFDDDSLLEMTGEISYKQIKTQTIDKIKTELTPFLEAANKEKLSKIKTHIEDISPQFRHLVKYEDKLKQISYTTDPDKLDIELYRMARDITIEIKQQGQSLLLKKPADLTELPEYKERLKRFMTGINDIGQSNLVEHVIHRKLILDIFKQALEIGQGGSYELESTIHNIIFPRNYTSDDVSYEQQNLWIIDERLTYHKYLASDKTVLESNNKEKPDLLICFDNPMVYTESSTDIGSIVIIELKRPGRRDYSAKDNPISQINNYIAKIKQGQAITKTGRPITVGDTTQFYAYIICDLVPQLRAYAEDEYDFTSTPDKRGYFNFHSKHHSYIEIISYEKLLVDSEKRNRVLFEVLNLK